VRQDEEILRLEALDHRLRDGLRLEHPVERGHALDASIGEARGHRRAHGLRAEHGHADALVAVRQREPLREPDGRVLGHRIGRRADLRQQPCGGGGVEQVAAAPGGHPRHEQARRVHLRHEVDLPDAVPGLVRDLGAARHEDAGVRAEEVDRAVVALGGLDQRREVGLARHIHAVPYPARLARGPLRALSVEVGADDEPRAFASEPQRHRAADAAGSTGDDDDLPFDAHDRHSSSRGAMPLAAWNWRRG